MKTANKIATAAAAFMMAAAAQAWDYTPPKLSEVDVTVNEGLLTLAYKNYSCTKDQHLVSTTGGMQVQLDKHPVSDEQRLAIKRAYLDIMAMSNAKIHAVIPAILTAEEFNRMVTNKDLKVLRGPLSDEKTAQDLRGKIDDVQNEILENGKRFQDAFVEILGREASKHILVNSIQGEASVAGAPSPLCK